MMTEMRIRLNTPLDALQSSFGRLVEISDALHMPLKQVMSDYMQLAMINQKFNFTQEQLLGLYTGFTDEIKKGTISVADFQKVLRGMSETSTDKAIGIGALLQSVSPEMVLSGVSGKDKGGVASLLSMIGKMDTEDVGMFLKMASQPNADKNPFMQGLMDKYGLSQGDLSAVQPNILKSLLGMSKGFAGTGGSPAISQMILESFGGLEGLGLASDYYTQGKQVDMINRVGTSTGFTGLNAVNQNQEFAHGLHTQRNPFAEMELNFQKSFLPIVNKFNEEFSKSGDIFKAYTKVQTDWGTLLHKQADKMMHDIATMSGMSAPSNAVIDVKTDWLATIMTNLFGHGGSVPRVDIQIGVGNEVAGLIKGVDRQNVDAIIKTTKKIAELMTKK